MSALALGILGIFWLPVEDLDDHYAVLFAAAICTLLAARWVVSLSAQKRPRFILYIFIGSLAGLAVSPLAVLLMTFKIGLHSHPVPDFTFAQITAVALRAPIWTMGGGLIGLGIAFLDLARS
jgi:hypothetical protein